MKHCTDAKILRFLIFILGTLMLFFAYFEEVENDFQAESENYVVGSMVCGARECGNSQYGLTLAIEQSVDDGNILDVMREYFDLQSVIYFPYTSQIGLQGHVCRTIAHYLCAERPVSAILTLRSIFCGFCCAALALVATGISFVAGKKHNFKLAIAFFLTFLLSPWVKNFAPNLYWVEFTWFVPMLLGMVMSLNYKKYDKFWFYILIFMALAIKSACGYEYITTVMLGLILFPLVDLLTVEKDERKKVFIVIFKLGIAALAGFFAAISIHALTRGSGDIVAGIKDIYEKDVMRRTVGIYKFDFVDGQTAANYKKYIETGVLYNLKLYFDFHTFVLDGLSKEFFVPLTVIALVFFSHSARKSKCRWELILFLLSALCTISWFVLAKEHSYIHTHMNYVLWYFGFVQMLVYALMSIVENATERVRVDNSFS